MSTRLLRYYSFTLPGACLLLLGGCVSVMTDPLPFNARLGPQEGGAGPRLSCLSEEYLSTCVLPGMKLVVLESDPRDHTLQDRTLVESRSEWVVPKPEAFGQQDLFQLARLLAVATPVDQAAGPRIDASRCYEAWLETQYLPAFRAEFVPRFLETLTLRYEKRAGSAAGTAQSVQEWLRGMPLMGSYPSPRLYFSIPRGTRDGARGTVEACGGDSGDPDLSLRAFGGGSPFQRQTRDDTTTSIKDELRSGWYRTDSPLVRSRSFLAVMVPVTVARAPGLHYVPIDASLDDLPDYLGIPRERFKGVRRDTRLLPPSMLQHQPYASRIMIRAASGSHALADATVLPVRSELMRQLLVAPGDEVVMSHY